MGTEPLPTLLTSNDDISLRKRSRGSAPVAIEGYSFTCSECTVLDISPSHPDNPEVRPSRTVPVRCEPCTKEKYSWLTRKKLQKEVILTGRASLQTYTLGPAQYTDWVLNNSRIPNIRDTQLYWDKHTEMKNQFRKLLRSKWWRKYIDGCFYTVEVKVTEELRTTGTDSGPVTHYRWKLHPHVHAITQHEGFHDFKAIAPKYGLGNYVHSQRIQPQNDGYASH